MRAVLLACAVCVIAEGLVRRPLSRSHHAVHKSRHHRLQNAELEEEPKDRDEPEFPASLHDINLVLAQPSTRRLVRPPGRRDRHGCLNRWAGRTADVCLYAKYFFADTSGGHVSSCPTETSEESPLETVLEVPDGKVPHPKERRKVAWTEPERAMTWSEVSAHWEDSCEESEEETSSVLPLPAPVRLPRAPFETIDRPGSRTFGHLHRILWWLSRNAYDPDVRFNDERYEAVAVSSVRQSRPSFPDPNVYYPRYSSQAVIITPTGAGPVTSANWVCSQYTQHHIAGGRLKCQGTEMRPLVRQRGHREHKREDSMSDTPSDNELLGVAVRKEDYVERIYEPTAEETAAGLDMIAGGAAVHFVSFRGMDLSLGWRAPTFEDFLLMKSKTTVRCSIRVFIGKVQHDFKIGTVTRGACYLTQELANQNLFSDLIKIALHRKITVIDAVAQFNRERRSPIPHRVSDAAQQTLFIFGGLSFGCAVSQSAAVVMAELIRYYSRTEHNALLDHTYLRVMMFGAPRIGDLEFATLYNRLDIPTDQFVMHSYWGPGEKDRSGNEICPEQLYWDPVAFWPANLYPVGNIYSLVYYKYEEDGEVVLATNIKRSALSVLDAPVGRGHFNVHGLALDHRTALAVPPNNRHTFVDLHFFPKYNSFFAEHECESWHPCSKTVVSEDDRYKVDPSQRG